MNSKLQISDWENKIFNANYYNFNQLAKEIFFFQYKYNDLYKEYVDSIGISPSKVNGPETIPYLPISFFKTHKVVTTKFEPEIIFESSGTTGDNTSRHFIKTLELYQKSFSRTFKLFYGNPGGWCILGLLPGYLDRKNSSLITMAKELIQKSNNPFSGFYLRDYDKLYQTLVRNEIIEQPTLLIGVTYALLDFAERYSMKLENTIVMETGGMKGKREEVTREEVHRFLKKKLGLKMIHSEYGMTELLSQAYSKGNGLFATPPWMRVLVREYNDPFAITESPKSERPVNGLINVIDLANIYSCSFIATDDVGKIYKDHTFEVLGRRDTSDLRGCSLLTL